MNEENRNYLLVIKRNNNDYRTLEWNMTHLYHGEDLTTLKGIDSFTSKITKIELLEEILKENFIDINDKFQDFAIIYYEKGKTRELKDGTIFKEDYFMPEDTFLNYLLNNQNNKKILSQIYNLCVLKSSNPKLEEFKYILKNISIFQLKDQKTVLAALLQFKELPYNIKRSILIKFSRKYL